jgi:hypothetical protein
MLAVREQIIPVAAVVVPALWVMMEWALEMPMVVLVFLLLLPELRLITQVEVVRAYGPEADLLE